MRPDHAGPADDFISAQPYFKSRNKVLTLVRDSKACGADFHELGFHCEQGGILERDFHALRSGRA